MKNATHFIIIDDDPFNNTICGLTINDAFPDADIQAFTIPEEGIEYLKNTYSTEDQKETILFLDLNMPTMTGWEVLQCYEKLSDKIKNQIKIFILSSSVDERDRERANQNPNVVSYLEKALSSEMVISCLETAGFEVDK